MNELKKSIHDNANGLDYTLVNDHYLPNLTAAAPAEQHPTGRWGRLHKMYLKEQRPIQYNQLLLSGVMPVEKGAEYNRELRPNCADSDHVCEPATSLRTKRSGC